MISNSANLQLVSRGGPFNHRIRAIASKDDDTYICSGDSIHCWRRGRFVDTLQFGELEERAKLTQMIVLGTHIISVDRLNRVLVHDIGTRNLITFLEFPSHFKIQCVLHPPTYLDKILVCGSSGEIQLWNYRKGRMVYNFNKLEASLVSACTGNALDVAAFGLQNGVCVILDLKSDEIIAKLSHDHIKNDAVTSCSFRSDETSQFVCGTSHGEIVVWDLHEKELLHVEREAHMGPITSLQFLNKEPILVTSGMDNSLKMWVFDRSEGVPRLLRERTGHSVGSSFISLYINEEGHDILSAGEDGSLRVFSAILERKNREFSQKKITRKRGGISHLPPIVMLDSNVLKELRFSNIITCHEGDDRAYLWNFFKKTIDGKHIIMVRNGKGGRDREYVSAVGISACGNHCFTGTSEGHIEFWNTESTLWRGAFEQDHDSAVTGLRSDSVNEFVFSSSLDGTLRIWSFKDRTLQRKIDFATPITQMKVYRGRDLILLALDDFTVRIIDPRDFGTIRKFESRGGHPILDFAVSRNMKSLAVSSMDCTLSIFSVMDSALLREIKLDVPIRSLFYDYSGGQLFTTYVGKRGMYVWIDRDFYSSKHLLQLDSSDEIEEEGETGDSSRKDDVLRPKDGILTSSTTSTNNIHRLANYSLIKEKSKPSLPAPVDIEAPFFLPTKPGLEPKFEIEKEGAVLKRKRKITDFQYRTQLAISLLQDADEAIKSSDMEVDSKGDIHRNRFEGTLRYLEGISASTLEFEISSLGGLEDENTRPLELFLLYCYDTLRSGTNVDLVQVHLKIFLEFHGEVLLQESDIKKTLEKVLHVQRQVMDRFTAVYNFNLSAIDHLCHIRV